MLSYVDALKCNQTHDSEYSVTESHKITTSNCQESEDMEISTINCTEDLLEFTMPYKNKEVIVHLELPTEQNQEAADDFLRGLKELYLRKIRDQYGQGETSALQSTITKEKEEK